jgi:hypothetical protein
VINVVRVANLEIPLPETNELLTEEIPDPLSPAELAAQTRRLRRLIRRAKRQADPVLLRSLRRELVATRWAFVKVTSVVHASE